ncbi:MAG TPA: hypothetical protein PKE57_08770 [Cellvibrionaceae bacterium]|nr:hypothetical protein [Cellvibrionaceae bacterium]HMW48072.1 hypothetical protein [Cellvibrionaceae bacterium]HMW72034.1 hypothetical protein [Cellvibrionaceae bacterium]HNG59200.1 hypothetical protein [Cellvibrionaceae bacterium]
MHTYVAFTSDMFQPFLPESAQVNPHCYGAELAWWLCQQLAGKGFVTSYPNSEDWGWFIEYAVDDYEYWLCCGNVPGASNRWQIYLDCKPKGLFGRDKAPVALAEDLLTALVDLLATTSGVGELIWRDSSE